MGVDIETLPWRRVKRQQRLDELNMRRAGCRVLHGGREVLQVFSDCEEGRAHTRAVVRVAFFTPFQGQRSHHKEHDNALRTSNAQRQMATEERLAVHALPALRTFNAC